mmetsp:Transcript_36318/g.82606  ORF Transcript_36318/g.82606 Transcript_36318/m.82606 type:complete len:224 (+) Transcript_36318:853-1524(+)
MPCSKAATSSVRVAIVPLASSMALFRSEAAKSSSFLESSFLSISDSQYAFFWSSLACSSPSKATMSSIMVRTFSKLTFLPRRASTKKSSLGSLICALALRACNARCLTSFPLARVWMNDGLGSVPLKSSRASSSLRILIVSAMATCSSARVVCTTSHSCLFFSQFESRSARNFLSSARDLVVSSKSSFSASIFRPAWPWRPSLASIACVVLPISFFLAATSDS